MMTFYTKNKLPKKYLKHKKNKCLNNNYNMGFYIPYSTLYPNLSSEYIDKLYFMTRSVDRNMPSNNNIFEWNCNLTNQIKNLIYIYPHVLSIPTYPFILKTICNIQSDIITFISINIIESNETYIIDNKHISISYMELDETNNTNDSNESNINNIKSVEFVIDFDISNLYMIDFKNKQNFLYRRSNDNITNHELLYLEIDPNNNMRNDLLSTNNTKHFTFKMFEYVQTKNYVYYVSTGQYIFLSMNELQNINRINVAISDHDKKLSNSHINWKLNKLHHCYCVENNTFLPSCYCSYIRHPFNSQNKIDIGFKIGIVKNEQFTEIFTRPN
jgi:hypothetical protein